MSGVWYVVWAGELPAHGVLEQDCAWTGDEQMKRREFLGLAAAAALAPKVAIGEGMGEGTGRPMPGRTGKPAMELGLKVSPASNPEMIARRVHDLGFSTTFFSLDEYIGKFTPALAKQFRGLLDKYGLTLTAVEVVGPGP